jgi:hypothetical protein
MKTTDPRFLVYREGKGCKQYPLADFSELQKFCQRKPYSTERLKVIVLDDMRVVADSGYMPATELLEWVE